MKVLFFSLPLLSWTAQICSINAVPTRFQRTSSFARVFDRSCHAIEKLWVDFPFFKGENKNKFVVHLREQGGRDGGDGGWLVFDMVLLSSLPYDSVSYVILIPVLVYIWNADCILHLE